MAKVSAIVLAAGRSTRMGEENKMALDYLGKPLVFHVIDQVRKSSVFETIIVTSKVSQDLFEEPVIINEKYESGMTSSIQAGVQACSPETEGYMICLGDQPLISTESYDQIIALFQENLAQDEKTIVLPTFQGQKGNPVIFSSSYREAILAHEDPEGCKGIVQANKQHLHFAALQSSAILKDVDRPEDYKDLLGNKEHD